MGLIATIPLMVVASLGSFTSAPFSTPGSASFPEVSIATAESYFDSSLPQPPPESSHRPNIVFVLTDDLSTDLIQYMPHVQALEQRGITFTNYTVADSLCCPSRASIFTSEYPHNTKVFENLGPYGGFSSFNAHQDETHTFAVAMHNAGYRTAFAGKYLNGYVPDNNGEGDVPPGWSSWGGIDMAGYNEYNYNIALGTHLASFGSEPGDYATTVLDELGQNYIRTAKQYQTPFFLELATFAPHEPYVPAPQDRTKYPDLTVPHTPAWDTSPTNAPAWLQSLPQLTPDQIAKCNAVYRKRVRDVLSVDRMVGHLQTALQQTGQLQNTVFVFSSDNGFHIGQYRLMPGKLTAFDTDLNVPLVIAGPGIPAGSTNVDLVQNVDLAMTFDQLAGARMPGAPVSVDGHSIVSLLHGQDVPWRAVTLIEQWGEAGIAPADPDAQSAAAAHPPRYTALRTADWTYVKYSTGEHEFYDRDTDPYMLNNIYNTLSPQQTTDLDATATALPTCAGTTCWQQESSLPSSLSI
jgi:arylsulfatase A-like enzyme